MTAICTPQVLHSIYEKNNSWVEGKKWHFSGFTIIFTDDFSQVSESRG